MFNDPQQLLRLPLWLQLFQNYFVIEPSGKIHICHSNVCITMITGDASFSYIYRKGLVSSLEFFFPCSYFCSFCAQSQTINVSIKTLFSTTQLGPLINSSFVAGRQGSYNSYVTYHGSNVTNFPSNSNSS